MMSELVELLIHLKSNVGKTIQRQQLTGPTGSVASALFCVVLLKSCKHWTVSKCGSTNEQLLLCRLKGKFNMAD